MSFDTSFPPPPVATDDYCCPTCHGLLAQDTAAYFCNNCRKTFPIDFGIPDFRLEDDPYINIPDDRAKGARIVRECRDRSLAGLLQFYWSITENVEANRARQFVATVLRGGLRAESIVTWLQERKAIAGRDSCLEIGCGAGEMLPVLKRVWKNVTGVDRAYRWLVIAKLAAEHEGLNVRLVCANAEHLPFRSDSFDAVVADNVIEHQNDHSDQLAFARDALRVSSRQKGFFFLSTPNRFAPLPDPHFNIPLLGMLPRGSAKPMVQLLRGKAYEFIRLLSSHELKCIMDEAGATTITMVPAQFGRDLFALKSTASAYRALAKQKTFLMVCPVIWALASKDA
ncbi:methyltransferase domain-containing protein [Candidatus Sumerlaeota bacterium]|nr:methyltransferase domain-containing protein [Candidatus Sumerlaeota bacterium]